MKDNRRTAGRRGRTGLRQAVAVLVKNNSADRETKAHPPPYLLPD
jgi:hypothetical protein